MKKEFLGFEEITDGSDKGLVDMILSNLARYGLDTSFLRGQVYDGCAAMKGDVSGAQVYIKKTCSKAVYTHCSSHILNFVVNDAAKVREITKFVRTVNVVINFIRSSAKRLSQFKDESSGASLLARCQTRWTQQHDSLVCFKELFPAVLEVLEKMSNWPDRATSSKAEQLIATLSTYKFVFSLCVAGYFARLLSLLCVQLHNPSLDIAQCEDEIENITCILQIFDKMLSTCPPRS